MNKFTQFSQYFHRAPLAISFLAILREPRKKYTSKIFFPSIVHLLHKVHPGCKVREMSYLFIVTGASKCLL